MVRSLHRAPREAPLEPPPTATEAVAGTTPVTYQPALDGVRALAVIAVVLFHAEVPGFDGGYLGVSVFFTLSGYLITTLLLTEHERTGRIDLRRFYGRRIRRLLPAGTACLAAVAVLAVVTDVFDGVADLRRQIIGAALEVANWVLLAGEGSYQELFQNASGTRSPLEHYWSLAIEQQFYWIWPPVMLVVLRAARTDRARTRVLAVITLVFALAAPVIAAVWGADAAYWSTPARMAEILMGALLAVVLAHRVAGSAVAPLAGFALAVLTACVVLFPQSGGPAYAGWLPAIAVVSAALILGLQTDGPVRRALSVGPLVWIGGLSYGIYLYHWPILVVLDADRLGFDGPSLLAVQLAATLAISVASSHLLERPIRRTERAPGRPTFVGAAAVTASVVVFAAVLVPVSGNYWEVDDDTVAAAAIEVTDAPLGALTAGLDAADLAPESARPVAPESIEPAAPDDSPAEPIAPDDEVAAEPAPERPPLPPLPRPVRIVVTGDSTADATGGGLVQWAADHPELAQVEVLGAPGCGFLLGGERDIGEWQAVEPLCHQWLGMMPDLVAERQPDVVVLMTTSWDLLDRRWDGQVFTPLDDEFAERLTTDFGAITDRIIDTGASTVVWVRAPIPNVDWRDRGTGQEDPRRHAVLASVYDELVRRHPGVVSVIALDDWLDAAGLADDRSVRPDGVHWDPDAAARIAESFLGEELVRRALGATAG